MNERNLDAAIDRAVRKMMRIDPAPGLRSRVAARIAVPERRGVPAFAFSLAAAAVLILAVVLWRPAVAPPPAEAPAVATTAPATSSVPLTAPSQPVQTAAVPASPPAPPQAVRPRKDRLPEPPSMAAVFGPRRDHVAATNVTPAPATRVIVAAPLQRIEMRISPLLLEPVRILPDPVR